MLKLSVIVLRKRYNFRNRLYIQNIVNISFKIKIIRGLEIPSYPLFTIKFSRRKNICIIVC